MRFLPTEKLSLTRGAGVSRCWLLSSFPQLSRPWGRTSEAAEVPRGHYRKRQQAAFTQTLTRVLYLDLEILNRQLFIPHLHKIHFLSHCSFDCADPGSVQVSNTADTSSLGGFSLASERGMLKVPFLNVIPCIYLLGHIPEAGIQCLWWPVMTAMIEKRYSECELRAKQMMACCLQLQRAAGSTSWGSRAWPHSRVRIPAPPPSANYLAFGAFNFLTHIMGG